MSRLTPSEAVVETLRAEGITDVPGIVGSGFMDLLDLFPAAGLRFISVRHEQAAAHMADAYARVTGRPAVCIGQSGPGITNMVTGIAAAYHAHSPVVVLTPSTSTASVGMMGFQEVDQLPIFRPITVGQFQVPRPDRMAETLRTAFKVAISERGPVQVDIPRDYFYGESREDILEPHQYRAVDHRPSPAPGLVHEAADLLQNAKFPVIIAGGGVVASEAHDQVRELADHLGAPVVSSYLHNDSFPASHPLALGPIGYQGSKAAMKVLSRADVVLALGCRVNVFGTLPQYDLDFWPAGARIIQVDIDHRQMGRSKPIELGIVADARATAEALHGALQATGRPAGITERLEAVAAARSEWRDELRAMSSSDDSPISPRRALAELVSCLPEEAIVSTDVGNISSMANAYLQFESGRSFLPALGFGNCGFAFPAALGAKLAEPSRPVVAVVGDGAWGMSLSEVMTAVEEDLPVTVVVFNNRAWGAEKRNQISFYDRRFIGTHIGWDVGGFNYSEIAAAMGADSMRITEPGDLKGAFSENIGSDKPTLIEVMVDTEELAEPFRRDALQRPTRYLAQYEHLNLD